MKVFLDLDRPFSNEASDGVLGEYLLDKFKPFISRIGKRVKDTRTTAIAYDKPSVALYEQARELYCLGFFASAIMVCRATAEYLAYELFIEKVKLQGQADIVEKIAESIDFRNMLDNIHYDSKSDKSFLDKETKGHLHELYTLGNKWIHPKQMKAKNTKQIEQDSLKAIKTLGFLIFDLRNILTDYDILNGVLVPKSTSPQNTLSVEE